MGSNLSGPEAHKMAKASWGGKVIAESSATVVVEGHQYSRPKVVNKEFLKPSNHTTVCPWKGTAHYFHVAVDGMQTIMPLGITLSEARSRGNQGPHRVLERRPRQALTPCASRQFSTSRSHS